MNDISSPVVIEDDDTPAKKKAKEDTVICFVTAPPKFGFVQAPATQLSK
jgi:hypothetical protein